MPLIYSRPSKLDHAATIRYEIQMLRFSYQRLAAQNLVEREAWVFLESFLLHYRNLIDFLGNDRLRPGDLHITNIWTLMNLTEPANLGQIYDSGKKLRAKYEPPDVQGGGRISQYLQHCTEKRVDFKDWEVSTMYTEIEPLLSDVDKYLGPETGILKPVPAVETLSAFSASTTTGTHTAVAAVSPESDREKRTP
jgi:hypothetical protein